MSPRIDELKSALGRDLKPGDILVRENGELHEITSVQVPGISRSGYVNTRLLTSRGPASLKMLRSMDSDHWNYIIREEDRIDKPSLRER